MDILPTNAFIDEFCDAFGTQKFSWWMTSLDNYREICDYVIQENNQICNLDALYQRKLKIFTVFKEVVQKERPGKLYSPEQLVNDAVIVIKQLEREHIRLQCLLAHEQERRFNHILYKTR